MYRMFMFVIGFYFRGCIYCVIKQGIFWYSKVDNFSNIGIYKKIDVNILRDCKIFL